MKSLLLSIVAAVALFLPPTLAWAEDLATTPVVAENDSLTTPAFIESSIAVIKAAVEQASQEGVGAATIGIIALLAFSQILIQLTKTPLFFSVFKSVNDKGKLTIVAVCTFLTTFLPLLLSGLHWFAALTSTSVVAALMVAGHQVYKHFWEKA